MDGISVSDLSEVIASDVGEVVIGLGCEDGEILEILVSDMSEIAAPLHGRLTDNNTKGAKGRPIRKTVKKKFDDDEDDDEEEDAVDSGDEQEKPKGKRGRPKTKKTSLPVAKKRGKGRKSKKVQEDDDDDLSDALSQISITSSPVKKRGRKPRPAPATINPMVSASATVVHSAAPPSPTPTKDGNKRRVRRTKRVTVASSKAGGSLSAIQKSLINIHDLEQDEIIRPEDLVGFEDIEIYSQDMQDEDEKEPDAGEPIFQTI